MSTQAKQVSLTSPDALTASTGSTRALKKQIDEINREVGRLERFLQSSDAAYEAEWSREDIDFWTRVWEERGGSGLERDIRVHDTGRRAADDWYANQRPKQLAELQRLREETQRLQQCLCQAIQGGDRKSGPKKKRGRPRKDALDDHAREIRELKDRKNKSWTQVANEMRRRHPRETFTVGKCRHLYNRETCSASVNR